MYTEEVKQVRFDGGYCWARTHDGSYVSVKPVSVEGRVAKCETPNLAGSTPHAIVEWPVSLLYSKVGGRKPNGVGTRRDPNGKPYPAKKKDTQTTSFLTQTAGGAA